MHPNLSVRTKSLQLSENGVDDFNISTESSNIYLSGYLAAYPEFEVSLRQFFSHLPKAQGKFFVPRDYVNRPALENRIVQAYNTTYDMNALGFYTIIVGSKNAGKSSATAIALDKKPGVVCLKVSQAEMSSFGSNLLESSGLVLPKKMKSDVNVVYPLLAQIAKTGHPITIVFEEERWTGEGSNEDSLYMVRFMAKELAPIANVIIVVSEASALVVFGDDRRQKFVWVEGMTHEEATMYAKKVFPAVADHDLTAFFEKVVGWVFSSVAYTNYNTHP